jgi:F0F1-type ATP synthase membrane subunit a
MTQIRLTLENDTIINNPTSNQIALAISTLNTTDNTFAILESDNMTYIQTGFQNTGEFVLEFQDGSLDQHY